MAQTLSVVVAAAAALEVALEAPLWWCYMFGGLVFLVAAGGGVGLFAISQVATLRSGEFSLVRFPHMGGTDGLWTR